MWVIRVFRSGTSFASSQSKLTSKVKSLNFRWLVFVVPHFVLTYMCTLLLNAVATHDVISVLCSIRFKWPFHSQMISSFFQITSDIEFRIMCVHTKLLHIDYNHSRLHSTLSCRCVCMYIYVITYIIVQLLSWILHTSLRYFNVQVCKLYETSSVLHVVSLMKR